MTPHPIGTTEYSRTRLGLSDDESIADAILSKRKLDCPECRGRPHVGPCLTERDH